MNTVKNMNTVKKNLLFGRTFNLFDEAKNREDCKLNFFKPFESFPEGASRGASLITAPLCLTGFSVFFFLNASWNLLKYVANIWDKQHAKIYLVKSKDSFGCSGILLLMALASIVTNIVDFIGAAVNTLIDIIKNRFVRVSYKI